MIRILFYLITAIALTGMNRFEEVRFVTQGQASLHSAFYGARIGMTVCALAAIVAVGIFLAARHKSKVPISSLLHWSALPRLPLLAFLPLAFNNWGTSRWMASPAMNVEITSGWGGPLANTYFIVAVLTAMLVEPAVKHWYQNR